MNARTNLQAPLPLGHHQALKRAAELRELGWTWLAVTDAMRIYHGVDRAESTWRKNLRGRVTPCPRGGSFRVAA